MSTLSIAIGASCIENAQSQELGTLLAGQIARACAIFNIDEVIVLDDGPKGDKNEISAAAALFGRVLQFMETPQYLRRSLIPMHNDLKFAGMLPPLDAPHHLRASEWCAFREGLVLRVDNNMNQSIIDIGLDKSALVDCRLKQGARVTLHLGAQEDVILAGGMEFYKASIVSPLEPKRALNKYWGYSTRIARDLKDLMENCPFEGGYDLKIGTSERGEQEKCCSLSFQKHCHALVVLGGPQGLEYCLQNDPLAADHKEPSTLFDRYLNVCVDQGSRTIRTEEALLIALTFLKPAFSK